MVRALLLCNDEIPVSGWFASTDALRHAVFYYDRITRITLQPSIQETANFYPNAQESSPETQSPALSPNDPHLYVAHIPIPDGMQFHDILALYQQQCLDDYPVVPSQHMPRENPIQIQALALFKKSMQSRLPVPAEAALVPAQCMDEHFAEQIQEILSHSSIIHRRNQTEHVIFIPRQIREILYASLFEAVTDYHVNPSVTLYAGIRTPETFIATDTRLQPSQPCCLITCLACIPTPAQSVPLTAIVSLRDTLRKSRNNFFTTWDYFRASVAVAESPTHALDTAARLWTDTSAACTALAADMTNHKIPFYYTSTQDIVLLRNVRSIGSFLPPARSAHAAPSHPQMTARIHSLKKNMLIETTMQRCVYASTEPAERASGPGTAGI